MCLCVAYALVGTGKRAAERAFIATSSDSEAEDRDENEMREEDALDRAERSLSSPFVCVCVCVSVWLSSLTVWVLRLLRERRRSSSRSMSATTRSESTSQSMVGARKRRGVHRGRASVMLSSSGSDDES